MIRLLSPRVVLLSLVCTFISCDKGETFSQELDSVIIRGQDELAAALPRLRTVERIGSLQLNGLEETDLRFLDGLQRVDELILTHNYSLVSLDGLQGVEEIGTLQLGSLPLLEGVTALGSTLITSEVHISNCQGLREVVLQTADTLQSVSVNNSMSIVRVSLPDLRAVAHDLTVGDIDDLRYVHLPLLQSVGKRLLLTSLPALEKMTFGPAPVEVDELKIQQMKGLTTLAGTDGLRSVRQLNIRSTPGLVDLSALSETTVEKQIMFSDLPRPALCTVPGLFRRSTGASLNVRTTDYEFYDSAGRLLEDCE